jgi:hypothetical protein
MYVVSYLLIDIALKTFAFLAEQIFGNLLEDKMSVTAGISGELITHK